MKVIIVGCGRMGRGLARALSQKGEQVTIIDTEPEALAHLDSTFKGEKIVGVGFDKDLLDKAKIASADGVVACTRSDETNALVARIARNIYKVPRVIARLYDVRKADIYNSLGIQTLSTTAWGVQRVQEILSYSQLDSVVSIGGNTVEILRCEVPSLLVGRPVRNLIHPGAFEVIGIVRSNTAFLPGHGTIMEQGDILYISAATQSLDRLKNALGM